MMKSLSRRLFVPLFVIMLFFVYSALQAGVPGGWVKISGQPSNYSGVPDGISGDRENAYAWSMQFHSGYLYLGTARDVVGLVLLQQHVPPASYPPEVPVPTDLRGRIFRMKWPKGSWELFYVADPLPQQPGSPILGPDFGYRMMKDYTPNGSSTPTLYVGSGGLGSARMLAIDQLGHAPVPVFQTNGFSVRAMCPYGGWFFWASEVGDQPAIWYSADPLKQFKANPNVQFPRIDVPSGWFPKGAEILDMVTFNGFLYVFFFDHDWDNAGFWCAKLKSTAKGWQWQLIVGDQSFGALYPKGMGRPENGGATPFVFNGKMYVGTISKTMWQFLNGAGVDTANIPPTGTQIFRFDTRDKWERVVPPASVTNQSVVDALDGFANPTNLYLWRFAEQNGRLYAGTFDAQTALNLFAPAFGLDLPDLWDPPGFDLYSTADGVNWRPESVDGFGDQFNYGARTLLYDPVTRGLILGTANPFYGCQIWKKGP